MLNNINISGCASFLETGSTFNCIKACFWVSVKKVNGKRLIDFISLGACNFWMTDKKGGLLVILFHCKLDTTLLSRRSSSFDFTHKDKKNYLIGYILEIKIKSKNIMFQSHVQFSLVWRDNVIIYIGYNTCASVSKNSCSKYGLQADNTTYRKTNILFVCFWFVCV